MNSNKNLISTLENLIKHNPENFPPSSFAVKLLFLLKNKVNTTLVKGE